MLVYWKDLNGCHFTTAPCAKGADQKRRRLTEEETWESAERAFQAYGMPLTNVTYFKYLGWVLTAVDEDWTSVVGKLWKARKIWA